MLSKIDCQRQPTTDNRFLLSSLNKMIMNHIADLKYDIDKHLMNTEIKWKLFFRDDHNANGIIEISLNHQIQPVYGCVLNTICSITWVSITVTISIESLIYLLVFVIRCSRC